MNNAVDLYTLIETSLASSGVEISVSEVHGIVVGALTNHLKSGITPDLLKLVEPRLDPVGDRFKHLHESLYHTYRHTSQQLLEGQSDFDLLLPSQDEALQERVDGLACWARGYVLGLLYNDAFGVDQLPDSGAEIARDIMQIAEVDTGEGDENEEDWALAELHEYIKVGTQLIFELVYSEKQVESGKS
ncbi:MAG: UPF0149 family protein [Gammaproteobacteria bacterium]|nr:UPF0149 family protein [Gammaproteobacteria bacterium]